ncbi:MAG: hypothetical protein JJE25_14595 [Bacteroidia bacterium]|nr:hypothetical protein [Bacteroidia bacterium]
MKKEDYLPKGEAEFNEWQDNFIPIVTANEIAWNIANAALVALVDLQADYQPKYAVANKSKSTTRTGQQVKAKNLSTAAYKKGVRKFVNQYIAFNDVVTDDDRLAMKVTVRDTVRTPSGIPASVPDIFIDTMKGSRIKVTVRQQPDEEGRSKRGKPDDAAQFEVAVWAGDNAPDDPEDFPRKERSGKSPLVLAFAPADKGKAVNVYARWIGHKGQEGTWAGPEDDVVGT